MRVACIANSSAGRQLAQGRMLTALQAKWQDAQLCGVTGYGGNYLEDTMPGPESGSYLEKFYRAMELLMSRQPDMLVAVGGDGTSAYAADWLLRNRIDIPILGLGAGTANVGPIVTERDPDDLPHWKELVPVRTGAIEALQPDMTHIAYGFNDLVLGNSLLGTVDGNMVVLEAAAMARTGAKIQCRCLESIAAEDFIVIKNGKPLPTRFDCVGQIIASTVEAENFYGRAVTGLLCFTPGTPCQGAVFLSAKPIVTNEEYPEGFADWFRGAQLLLGPGDILQIRGLHPQVCAVADGNPYLLPDRNVLLRYVPNLFTILKRR